LAVRGKSAGRKTGAGRKIGVGVERWAYLRRPDVEEVGRRSRRLMYELVIMYSV
jgi:hypothetical protein